MSMNTQQKPPKHLSNDAKDFWRQVLRDFQLEDHHVRLLTGACECLDRATQARETVARDGPFFKTRYGEIRPHPGLQVERDQKTLLARLLRELNLDTDLPSEPYSRPPPLPGGSLTADSPTEGYARPPRIGGK